MFSNVCSPACASKHRYKRDGIKLRYVSICYLTPVCRSNKQLSQPNQSNYARSQYTCLHHLSPMRTKTTFATIVDWFIPRSITFESKHVWISQINPRITEHDIFRRFSPWCCKLRHMFRDECYRRFVRGITYLGEKLADYAVHESMIKSYLSLMIPRQNFQGQRTSTSGLVVFL